MVSPSRRDFLKSAAFAATATGLSQLLPGAIERAHAIEPTPGSTVWDAEHVVILMQENRSFDHAFGSLQGVRGFDDPRAIKLPSGDPAWVQTDAAGNSYAPVSPRY
jgi:phospholipase C